MVSGADASSFAGPMASQQDDPAFGRGFNSIPVRFALMSLVLGGLCCGTLAYGLARDWASLETTGALVGAVAVMSGLPAVITYLAASRLTGSIMALQRSTEAIASGDVDQPVDVDCACEVGGLAQSFRKMVARLNANILRMNVLAHTDFVTGLPNRVVFNHVLSLPSMQGTDGGCAGALFFIDLDGFKSVNDRFGHKTGDELLRQVSQRIITAGFGRRLQDIESCTTTFGELCQSCPRELVFARFAGDEFVAFLPGRASLEALQGHADAILAAVRRPFEIFGNEIHVGASIGIARAPEDSPRAADLLGFADFAMYTAKDRGKDGVVFFDQELRALAQDKADLEDDLRAAIAAGAMELYFQPKARASDLSVDGVEALLRWQHPTRGMVPPALFVAIAEKAGLMPALGRFVFEAAVRQHREWAARGFVMPIAVNVSALQFEDASFVTDLLQIIRRADVAPDMIEVEITETMVMADFGAAADKVRQLREAGLSVSVDDFGVGYSNLSQLSRLSVNALKIDRSLVMEIGLDRKAEAIILAVVGMAHAMGLKTIAEGVETPQQAAFLRKARIDAMQGYLLGLPMAPGHLESWASARGESRVSVLQGQVRDALIAS